MSDESPSPLERVGDPESRRVLLDGTRLIDELVRVRAARLGGSDDATIDEAMRRWAAARAAWWQDAEGAADSSPQPLVALQRRFGLGPREVDVLLVALAPLIDPDLLDRFAEARRSLLLRAVDVELVLSLLFPARADRFVGRDLLTPQGKLVRHGLVRLVPLGSELSPHEIEVRPSEALANFVLGRPLLAGPLAEYCSLREPAHAWDTVILPQDNKALVWGLLAGEGRLRRSLDDWGYTDVLRRGRGLAFLFAGPPGTGKTAFTHAIADRLGRRVLQVRMGRLMGAREGLSAIYREIFDVAALADAVVLMDDCEAILAERRGPFLDLLDALDDHDGVLVMTTNLAPRIDFAMERRILLRLDFELPPAALREQIWEVHLPPEAPLSSDIEVPVLASTYEFTGAAIRNTVLIALARLASEEAGELTMARLKDAAETQLRAEFEELAVKTDATMSLDDLILPDREKEQIDEVLAACKHHEDVLARWGFKKRLATGRGICVLFDGPPGTGKTLASELIASSMKRPLYRVHIPAVVSKWVGETERNIAQIFVRARASRAMLLFDEADALFGRRTSGGSANDRYANMEVNHLLQEIERYDGVTILTTNLYGNLDEALQRRIQFRVTFPFPDPEQRALIWEILLPKEVPTAGDLDFAALGKAYELSGGHIKNALLRAAYRAMDDEGVLKQDHLVGAAVAECKSQGKLVRTSASGAAPTTPLAHAGAAAPLGPADDTVRDERPRG